jgi:hypothetical protein
LEEVVQALSLTQLGNPRPKVVAADLMHANKLGPVFQAKCPKEDEVGLDRSDQGVPESMSRVLRMKVSLACL